MQTTYAIVLALHVIGGALGLGSMALPLLAKKGARLHKLTGWIFTFGMALSAATGIAMALVWTLAPLTFQPSSTPSQARLDGAFLALIGVLTGNALIQAVGAVRRKNPSARAAPLTKLSLALLLLAASAALALGVLFGQTLLWVFGLGSLVLATQDLMFIMRPLRSPMAWWYQHMNAMGTACISATTAFLVLGARRWLGSDVLGEHLWMLWVAPSALLVPLFQGWIVRYRRKFEPRKALRSQTREAHV